MCNHSLVRYLCNDNGFLGARIVISTPIEGQKNHLKNIQIQEVITMKKIRIGVECSCGVVIFWKLVDN